LIDSQGVREFALWHLPIDRLPNRFLKEFKRLILVVVSLETAKHGNDPVLHHSQKQ